MKSLRILMVLVGGVAVATVSAQGPMRAGRWDTIVQMQMPGMSMPPTKTSNCVTKEQIAVPSTSPGCTTSDYKVDGAKVTWKTTCKDMAGTGEIVFKGDTFEGQIAVTTPHQMTMKLSGKRVGDCTQ